MELTDYHAKYFACELTKKHHSGNIEGIIPALMDAQVDLNPHQIETALFAFASPLSKGAILADEVGLGKTIEAGILLSQKWAEQKRKILIIVPSSLRKQWNRELLEKFFLPSFILETKSFNKEIKDGENNPFDRDNIVICSYQFARNKSDFAIRTKWDLIVIDEAHRLRNVYKKDNKIAKCLRDTFKGVPKILLTATPLQNSLMEVYGLVSFIDEHVFGDSDSFKSQYTRTDNDGVYSELKSRLKPLCKRNLRKQVKEYIKYTNRIPITEDFIPTESEDLLYTKISEYLQRPNLKALPNQGRHLVTMVLRKILASSSFAISGALNKIITRLEKALKSGKYSNLSDVLEQDCESLEQEKEEWNSEETEEHVLLEERKIIEAEIQELKSFYNLAISIKENSKGKALLKSLNIGFKKMQEFGAKEKVIIFTESRKTQDYVLRVLDEIEEYKNKIILFNGSNTDEKSKEVYKKWVEKNKHSDLITGSKTADMRSALVDYFKDEAKVMIATEAAAEGINLQFCSLIVNYDLPWNPQRIEQRIGRCHRYGQKYDVVVINFLNKKNAADQRVFELLCTKFQLFEGVFGASDEVLGSVDSFVDFEKRILNVYQSCRSKEEIDRSFDKLQNEMQLEIDAGINKAKKQLMENFDADVIEKLKVCDMDTKKYISKHKKQLWRITKHSLKNYADFSKENYSFSLKDNHPFRNIEKIPLGPYNMGSQIKDVHIYRPRHPLAQEIIKNILKKDTPPACLTFNYSSTQPSISALQPLVGKSGYLELKKMTVTSFEKEEYLAFTAIVDGETELIDEQQCLHLFSLPATINVLNNFTKPYSCNSLYEEQKKRFLSEVTQRNSSFFDEAMEKLELWEKDKAKSLKENLLNIEKKIKDYKKLSREASNLPDKLNLEKKAKNLSDKKDVEWKKYEEEKQKINNEKDTLLDGLKSEMEQKVTEEVIFEIRWNLV